MSSNLQTREAKRSLGFHVFTADNFSCDLAWNADENEWKFAQKFLGTWLIEVDLVEMECQSMSREELSKQDNQEKNLNIPENPQEEQVPCLVKHL